jgi:hypothetical protein
VRQPTNRTRRLPARLQVESLEARNAPGNLLDGFLASILAVSEPTALRPDWEQTNQNMIPVRAVNGVPAVDQPSKPTLPRDTTANRSGSSTSPLEQAAPRATWFTSSFADSQWLNSFIDLDLPAESTKTTSAWSSSEPMGGGSGSASSGNETRNALSAAGGMSSLNETPGSRGAEVDASPAETQLPPKATAAPATAQRPADLPTVSAQVIDPEASEGLQSSGAFQIIRTGGDLTQPLTVQYELGGSATNGADYQLLSGSVPLAAGARTQIVRLEPIDDGVDEPLETITVAVANDANYTSTTDIAGTIYLGNYTPLFANNQRGGDNVTIYLHTDPMFSGDSLSSEDALSTAALMVERDDPFLAPSIHLVIHSDSTATLNVDYTISTQTVSLADRQLSDMVLITPIADDLYEGDETIIIGYYHDDPAYPTFYQAAVVTIRDLVPMVKLRDVTFAGDSFREVVADPGDEPYPSAPPHWLDANLDGTVNDEPDYWLPGSYVRDTKMSAGATLATDGDLPNQFYIRGDGPGEIDIPPTVATIEGNSVKIAPTQASSAFADYVDYFEHLAIEWQYSFDNGLTWYQAGVSDNQIYVVFDTPGTTLYHTVIHNAVMGATSASTRAEVIAGVWKGFDASNLKFEKFNKNILDNPNLQRKQLTYWKEWDNTNNTYSLLLEKGDGQCGAWTELFLECLKVVGIKNNLLKTTLTVIPQKLNPNDAMTENINGVGMLVKNWKFTGNGTNTDGQYKNLYPYENTWLGNPNTMFAKIGNVWQYRFVKAEVTDDPGVKGQGPIDDPKSQFLTHVIATVDNVFYDPSYGNKYSGQNKLSDFENNAIAGFTHSVLVDNTVQPPKIALYVRKNDQMKTEISDNSEIY